MAAAMSQQLTPCVDELIMVNGVDRKHDVSPRAKCASKGADTGEPNHNCFLSRASEIAPLVATIGTFALGAWTPSRLVTRCDSAG